MSSVRNFVPALLLGALTAAAAPRAANAPAAPVLTRADNAAGQHGFSPARNSGGEYFVSGKSTLRFTPDKPVCSIDGVKVHQCFPSRRTPAGLMIARLDAQKTIGPLSPQRSGVFRHRVATITLDPGHGGRDRGAAGKYTIEKAATLLMAYRVAAILRACGYRVYLTRNGDYYVPLAERCRIQRRHKSDLFVSIHFNAAEKKSFHGIETFALTPAGAASTSGGPPLNKRFFGNFFDANNLLLAYTIQKALLRRTGAFDRGVKRARFAVLKDIDAPGVLVEVGFVSNPREEQMMLNPAYRDKIARGIAEGIIVYHRIMLRR
jgi:N-acetylmuramoyl-L-alanine amidase